MADDGVGLLGNQLGCGVRGHLRLADVVFHEELHRSSRTPPLALISLTTISAALTVGRP